MMTLMPKVKNGRGHPLEFSDQFIKMLLMVKIHLRLPYRQLEGFARFLLEQMEHPAKVPTYSLTCKRAKRLVLCLPKLSSRQPTTVIVDASGVKYKEKENGK